MLSMKIVKSEQITGKRSKLIDKMLEKEKGDVFKILKLLNQRIKDLEASKQDKDFFDDQKFWDSVAENLNKKEGLNG